MKFLLGLSILASGAGHVSAQTEVKAWTQTLGGNDYDYGLAVATDTSRNVIVAGRTHSALGPALYGTYDMFVAKYDASGNKLWLAQRGTSAQESGEGVATDAAGNIYVTGYTGGDLDGNTSAGGWDIFLMKFDPAGNWLWTKQDGTGQDDDAHAIAIDTAGNVYITGYVRGDFHGITRVGTSDVFISKYSPSGTRIWSVLFGSTAVDEGFGIACDSSNNVYVTGYVQESVEGNPWLGTGDNILAKYNSNGERQWLKQWGTGNADTGHAAACDASGNVYVSGYSTGALYGPRNGNRDLFLAKYAGDGTFLWGKQTGSLETDQAYGMVVDSSGNVFITGEAGGSLYGNPYAGGSDAFLAKYDPAGNELWTTQLGTVNDDIAQAAAIDASGGVYMVGWTTGDFDGYVNQGLSDVFIAKYVLSNSPPPAPTANAATAVTISGFAANWSLATAATGYRLDLSTNSAFTTYVTGYQNLDVGNVLTRNTSGLRSGTTYYYRVRAYGSTGTSGNSATITVTTMIPVCTPGILLNSGFEGGNTAGVGANWTSYQRAPNPATTWSIQLASPPAGGGLQYQQILNSSSTGGAGVRQDVTGCTIGATYIISGWMRGNSASATCRVKVSPSASTLWSTAIDLNPPQSYSGASWVSFSGTVVATGTSMTIWLDGQTTSSANPKAACFDSVTVSCPIVPVPLHLDSVAWLPQNKVRLVLTGTPGDSVTLRTSSNLANWFPLTTLVNTNGTLQYTDAPAATAGQLFYRATSP